MDQRIRSLNIALKGHDRDLFAKRESHAINIYRIGRRWECHDFGEFRLHYSKPNPQFIVALTDDWRVTGRPVEWGIEPLLDRIKSIDGFGSFNLINDLPKMYEKAAEKKAQDRKSRDEEWLREHRDIFKKAFDPINTGTLDRKSENRRKKGK